MEISEPIEITKTVKKKRNMSEAQLANLKIGQEKRKAKLEAERKKKEESDALLRSLNSTILQMQTKIDSLELQKLRQVEKEFNKPVEEKKEVPIVEISKPVVIEYKSPEDKKIEKMNEKALQQQNEDIDESQLPPLERLKYRLTKR